MKTELLRAAQTVLSQAPSCRCWRFLGALRHLRMLAFAALIAAIATEQDSAAQEIGGAISMQQVLMPHIFAADIDRPSSSSTQNPFGDQEVNWSGVSGAWGSQYYSGAVPYLPNNKRTYRLQCRSAYVGVGQNPETGQGVSSHGTQFGVWIDDGLMVDHIPGPENLPPPQGPMRIRFKFHIKWSWSPADGNSWSLFAGARLTPTFDSNRGDGNLIGGGGVPVDGFYWTPLQDFGFGSWRWIRMNMAYFSSAGWNDPSSVSTRLKMTYADAEVVDGVGNVVDRSRWKLWRGLMPDSGNPLGIAGNEMESGLLLPSVALAPVTNLAATTATLNGTVNPNGFTTITRFEYGTTVGYGSNAEVTLSSADGETVQNATANLANLTPDTLYHYRLSATNAAGTSYTSDATFTTAALALIDWRQTFFGTSSDIGEAADFANPDGDAYMNLVEYALVLVPTAFSTGPEGGRFTYPEGDRLRIVFNRDPARHDVTIEVLAAGDLAGPWATIASSVHGTETTGPGYYGGDSAGPGLKTVEVRDLYNLNDPAHPTRFLRLRITR